MAFLVSMMARVSRFDVSREAIRARRFSISERLFPLEDLTC